jgi:hypothetical protein
MYKSITAVRLPKGTDFLPPGMQWSAQPSGTLLDDETAFSMETN